eukprot:gene2924-1906_t
MFIKSNNTRYLIETLCGSKYLIFQSPTILKTCKQNTTHPKLRCYNSPSPSKQKFTYPQSTLLNYQQRRNNYNPPTDYTGNNCLR